MSFDTMLANKPEDIQMIAKLLRQLILQTDNRITETIHGGEKVKIALYHIGHENNVLYGLQPAAKDCKLYLHHTDAADTLSLKLEGKGKHAKQVKFTKPLQAGEIETVKQVLKNILSAAGY